MADPTSARPRAVAATDGAAPASGQGYHHRDLRRALVSAARTLLETSGPEALTLRATARAAGVSTASPYHHFRSVEELRRAVAQEGWRQLLDALADGERGEGPGERLARFGVTCVQFAQDNPGLYWLMGQCLHADPPPAGLGEVAVYDLFRRAVAVAAPPGVADTPRRVELATTAVWSAVHGLAEISRCKSLDALKATLGGDRAFVAAVLGQLALTPIRPPAA